MPLALRRKHRFVFFSLLTFIACAQPPLRAVARAPALQFEVATVKPAAPSPDGHTHINYPEGGAFSASNITLAALMQWAWDMPKNRILDAPPWFDATRYDLQAKADAETDKQLRNMPGDESREAKRRMVQAMLAERFGMKVHEETRTLPAYDLEVARGGSKLQLSTSSGKSVNTSRTHFNATASRCRSSPGNCQRSPAALLSTRLACPSATTSSSNGHRTTPPRATAPHLRFSPLCRSSLG